MRVFINKHITAVFLIILTSTFSMALMVVWKVSNVENQIDVVSGQVDKIIVISDLREIILLQMSALNNYRATGREEFLIEFRKYTPQIIKAQQDLLNVIRESRKILAEELSLAYQQYISTCEEEIIPVITSGKGLNDSIDKKLILQKEQLLNISSEIYGLRKDDTLGMIKSAVEESKSASSTTIAFTIMGTIIGAATSLLVGSKFIQKHKMLNGILTQTRNINITLDEKGYITSINKTAQEYFGIESEFLLKRKGEEVLGRGKLVNLGDIPIKKVIETGAGICNLEKVYIDSDGLASVLTVDVLPLEDRSPCGALVVARDISERKVLEQRLYAMTLRDGLTGLFNHSFLKRKLHERVSSARDKNTPLSFILLDIDNFKFYNDRFGHQAGDVLLKDFSKVLASCIRSADILGIYGGDEFAVIIANANKDTTMILAERIRSTVEKYPFPNKHLMPGGKLTVSVGGAIFPEDAANDEELIKLADEAMYRCKNNLKNEIQIYSSALKEFQRQLKKSDQSRFNVVQTMLGIINAKDKDTFLHLEKVSEYVGYICKEMQLSDTETRDIKLGALLHDVGKLEIPRNILRKSEPLNEDEWSLIKHHPRWGATMVRSMQSMDSIIPMIVSHHERYDGKGYPYGLKGEDIPIGSRIISVADSFDAITNSRSYRAAKTYSEAMAEIKRCSGSQFDPVIVEVFESAYKKRQYFSTDQAGVI